MLFCLKVGKTKKSTVAVRMRVEIGESYLTQTSSVNKIMLRFPWKVHNLQSYFFFLYKKAPGIGPLSLNRTISRAILTA